MTTDPTIAPARISPRPMPLWARILRTMLVGLLLSAVVAGTLHLHARILPEFTTELLTDPETGLVSSQLEKNHKNFLWFVEQFGYLAPLLAVMILPALIYHPIDRRDGRVQQELTWVTVIVIAVTFLLLLPYTARISDAEVQAALSAGETFPTRDGGAYDTLLLKVIPWFLRLGVGLGILCLYHSTRAHREKEDAARGFLDGESVSSDPAAPASDEASAIDETPNE